MTFKEIAKLLETNIQTTPNLISILKRGFEEAEAGSDVEVTQIISSGTKIATIEVGEESTDIYAPNEIYSANEIEIGKWVDNKPIYRKVITITESTEMQEDTWTTIYTDSSISNIDNLISVKMVNTNHGNYDAFLYKCNGNDFQALYLSAYTVSTGVKYIIEYTKTA